MEKTASIKPADMASLYVAYLRALYQIHQNNHWKTKGDNFYGNHLLFQRLYEETQGMADGAAEKAMGVFGELDVRPETIAQITEKFNADNYKGDTVQSSLNAEKGFQALSRQFYDTLEEAGALSLGWDDAIMANANTSESHIYLLQQANGQ